MWVHGDPRASRVVGCRLSTPGPGVLRIVRGGLVPSRGFFSVPALDSPCWRPFRRWAGRCRTARCCWPGLAPSSIGVYHAD
eukprot:2048614-Prymnesium_polylepis.1